VDADKLLFDAWPLPFGLLGLPHFGQYHPGCWQFSTSTDTG